MFKSFDVCKSPVRDSKFIPKKSWIVCGSDNGMISVYNLNTYEKITSFEAQSDYIRSIAIHPTLSLVLSSSDDYKIKMWDWEKDWKNVMTFEGHSDYVMKVVFNPKDPSTFASASLDGTIKIWSINSPVPNFTLEGHREGVNDVGFYHGADKPFLISGSEDRSIKIWDYLLKSCIHTILKHTYSVTSVAFLPGFPFFISGSEDGTVRVWDSDTYHMEIALNYGVNRIWCLAYSDKKTEIAIGHDGGTAVVKLGCDTIPVSLDPNGKLALAVKKEIRVANLTNLRKEDIKDCETLSLQYKDLGMCELYPQRLIHSSKGRYVAVLGGGEYVIYTALAWRVKSFGKAADFAWGPGLSHYAVRESGGVISIKKNFEPFKDFTPNFVVRSIFGGPLLTLITDNYVLFYSWEMANCVGRLDISAKNIIWLDSERLAVVCDDMVYTIQHNFMGSSNSENESKDGSDDDSDDGAIKILLEIPESIKSGTWVDDTFIYVTLSNKVAYYFGNESTAIATAPPGYNLLGYVVKIDTLLLTDKDGNAICVHVPKRLMHLQRLIASGNTDNLAELAQGLPNDHKNQLSRFLESKKMYQLALEITSDDELRFELALMLNNVTIATEIAEKYQEKNMWRRIGDAALEKWDYNLSELAYKKAEDLTSLLMLYGSTCNKEGIEYISEVAATKLDEPNLALMCNFLLRKFDTCVTLLDKHQCHAEAALTAQTYAPSLLDEMTKKWKNSLFIQKKNTDT